MSSVTDVAIEKQEEIRTLARGGDSGVMALALMSEAEFAARLQTLKQGQDRIRRIQKELMVPEEDFGKIPGTDKPTLLKPGAEKLCAVYGLKASFQKVVHHGDGVTEPHLGVAMTCLLHVGDSDGPVVAQGEGAANSWERKHRYRRAQRSCPACGTVGSIRKSKYPDKRTGDIGWWCREESCKVNFESTDPAIIEQALGDVENPDPYDVENTLVKMALKRAYVDATLRATATSGLFAQDLEDMDAPDPAPRRAPEPAAPQAAREPGEDDAIETSAGVVHPGQGEHAEAAGAKDYRRGAGAEKGKTWMNCPKCGAKGMPSKFPKPGADFYCPACANKWGA